MTSGLPHSIASFFLGAIASAFLAALPTAAPAQDLVPDEIVATLHRSADWGLQNRKESNLNGWIMAPFYDGLLRTAQTTGDPAYLAAVLRFGDLARWAPGSRPYHADDHAVGHAWLDVYLADPTRTHRATPMQSRLDTVIANPITEALAFGKTVTTPGVAVTDRWTWCDALYMAPPTLGRLYTMTGDRAYLDFLNQEFLYTYDLLYDETEGLFYRDSSFINKGKPNGRKVFWSRGNGWVYGGLAPLPWPAQARTPPFSMTSNRARSTPPGSVVRSEALS